jgi:hypothetical protein
MPEISQFVVEQAYAEYNQKTGAVNATFYYPRNPIETRDRLGAAPEWGVEVLETLIRSGAAEIATPEHPISPPTAGSIPVTRDGRVICTRRDNYAPVHKMFQAGYSGFAETPDELYTEEGMRRLGVRESAEELVLITRDRNPHLITTESTRQETLKSAKRLGLEHLPERQVKEELIDGKDRLKVYYEDGEPLFTLPCFFTMLWNIDSSSIAMQMRKLDIDSDEILPIDAEGKFTESGAYKVHFNRESFIINPSDLFQCLEPQNLDELGYAHPMINPQVFQSHMDGKKRVVHTPHNSHLEYLGPGATPVNQPFLWAPQDTLRTCLDGLGVVGYENRKLHWELEIDRAFAENPKQGEACVIPPQFLAPNF